MEGYLILAITIIALILALRITRKEGQENNKLSKKGIYQLLALLAIVFISIVIIVFVTPGSWV